MSKTNCFMYGALYDIVDVCMESKTKWFSRNCMVGSLMLFVSLCFLPNVTSMQGHGRRQ
jgi:hypothetical protein